MSHTNLTLVLVGDQLTLDRGALRSAEPTTTTVLMAEVAAEARYVPHNRHKIALIFAAMRHFRDLLRSHGFNVVYLDYEMGIQSLPDALDKALEVCDIERLSCCEPGEWRVRELLQQWSRRRGISLHWHKDDRFLCSIEEFNAWAAGRKQLRMEYFYREMRRRHGLLLTDAGEPEGGRWSYDRENRVGWRNKHDIPQRPETSPDRLTLEVLTLVQRAFPDNPGDLSKFNLAVTSQGAEQQLAFFIEHCLGRFGEYQDALAEESEWLYHSLVSMYLNIGLLPAEASIDR